MKWWLGFEKQSVALTTKDYRYVVISDISAYYENIDIGRLISDISDLRTSADTHNLLSSCLNRWAGTRCRGLPQGFIPSDILSELYLDLIDHQLKDEGHRHLRYSDDVRIFCKSKREGIEALYSLTSILRDKGLNLQTAKSRIVEKKEAVKEFQYVDRVISKAVRAYRNDVKKKYSLEYPYCTPSEIRRLANSASPSISMKPIMGVFDKHFLRGEERFNKSLFHFTLTRLAAAENDHAMKYCLKALPFIPEETNYILAYFSRLTRQRKRIASSVAAMIDSGKIIPEYQRYQVLKWYHDEGIVTKKVLELVRKISRNPDTPPFIQAYCISYLGNNGSVADIERIAGLYADSADPLSKATVILGIRRMEKGRRNALYARAVPDDFIVEMAVRKAKQLTS